MSSGSDSDTYVDRDDKRAYKTYSSDDDSDVERKRKSHRRTRATGIVHGEKKGDDTR